MTTEATIVMASDEAIATLQKALAIALPEDYLSFLQLHNGKIRGSPDLYAIFDSAEEVPGTTSSYNPANEFAQGLVIIGSDGCGNLLGIDTRSQEPAKMDYVLIDACNITWQEDWYRASSLAQILAHLRQEPGIEMPGYS